MKQTCKYKKEQKWNTKMEQKWNTQWHRNGIHNGTEMEYTMIRNENYKMEQKWECKMEQQ